jgi:hypothetical protein
VRFNTLPLNVHTCEMLLSAKLHRLGISLTALVVATNGISGDSDYVLRWASSGGGWRSMISNIGYANAFTQAGLIDPVQGKCNFTAISSNSGGSWFTTQFFYSQPFFDNVVSRDKTSVYDFIINWLQSYKDFLEGIPRNALCLEVSPFGKIMRLNDLSSVCDIGLYYRGSYGGLIDGMLRKVSTGFGDPGLPDRFANAENRVLALRETDLFVQTSLAANSRYTSSSKGLVRSSDGVNYVSLSDSDKVLAVPLAAHYAVKANRAVFRFAVPDSSLPLKTYQARGPDQLRYDDWVDFHLYPSGDNRDIFASKLPSTSGSGLLAEPFRGNPNVAEIAAVSSATLSHFSGAAPSLFAQYSSVKRYDGRNAGEGFISKYLNLAADFAAANTLFKSQITRDFAVCSQWPTECGASDGRFLDGGYSDGPCKCRPSEYLWVCIS